MDLIRVVALLIPLALVGLIIWLQFKFKPRQRRRYAEHPESKPYGWKLALRMAPFMLAGVACSVTLALSGDGWGWFFLPVVMAVGFGWELKTRWRPPAER